MSMIILFFFTSFFAGLVLIEKTKIETEGFRLPAALVLGSVILTLLLFISGFIFPFSKITLLTIILLVLVISFWMAKALIPPVWYKLKSKLSKRNAYEYAAILFIVLLIFWLFGRALYVNEAGFVTAGDRLVWTDWPVHIGIASSFAWGRNFPPQNPMFAGVPLVYPFFADFLSGVFLALGVPLPLAFTLPGIILTLSFCALFITFAYTLLWESRIFKKWEVIHIKIAAYLSLFTSLFWGGLGFVFWLQEALVDEVFFVEKLLSPVREYTFWAEKGLWFFTFLYSEILPQRAFLFGLPLFFLVLLLLSRGWEKQVNRNFLAAGIIAGSLPFFHTHTYLSLSFLMLTIFTIGGVVTFIIKKIPQRQYLKALFLFSLPFGVLSVIQLPLFVGQSQAIRFAFGWMKTTDNFFIFWLKNTGLFIPLWWLGFWKGKFTGKIKLLGIASWILFILPNLFHFAPWGYDNLKILTYWYLIGSVFVLSALFFISRKGGWGKVIAIIFFLTLVLSGVNEVGRLIDTPKVQISLWSPEAQELGEVIKRKTEPEAVFLTAAIHDHPVSALSGRKIVIGYPGNMWSWGLKGWDERERDVHAMFKGGDEAVKLWKKYGIDYIIVSDRERWFEKELNEEFIRENGELVLDQGTARIYKIK